MKIAVLGITGSFGGAVAQALVDQGHEIRALVRDPNKAREVAPGPGVELIEGSATQTAAVERVVEGCEAMVYGINLPYEKWDPAALELLEVSVDVAERREMTLLFPGNVYGFGPDFSRPLSEEAKQTPPTRKGEIRVAMEQRLARAATAGARIIVLRAGDFVGPGSASSWFEHLTAKAIKGGSVAYPGPLNVIHQWAYLPDLGRIGVALLERRAELEPFEVFHDGGWQLDGHELTRAVEKTLGATGLSRFSWLPLQLLSPFKSFFRELLRMRYLWNEPVLLDGSKLEAFIGTDLARTSPADGMGHTLAALAPEIGGARERAAA